MDKDRLSHWIVLGFFCWIGYFLFFGLPIFHLLLGVSMFKVGSFFVLCGLMQLAVTPWIFAARPTAQNPNGNSAQRATAAAVWFVSTALLLLFYLQYGKAIDSIHIRGRLLVIGGVTAVFGLIAVLIGTLAFRYVTYRNRKPV